MNLQSTTPDTGDIIRASGIGFGTSGARGLVEDLTDEACAAFVTAFIAVVLRRFRFDRVAVGWDLRPSSPRIAAAVVAAIRAAGMEVECCGMLPTPALALHAMSRGVPAVMVTGSHIPFDRNGLKFYRPDGEIDKADEQAILAAEVPMPAIVPTGLPATDPAATEAYVRRALGFFPRELLRGRRIALYQHSSAARDILARILREFGAEVLELGRTDGFVPIDTEAVAEADIRRGRDWAREHALDAIVSTDGDGDRPLLADERGEWLRGDIVGLLCARQLGIDALAVPVSCNTAIERCGAFETVVRTRIGSPYVIEAMEGLRADGRRVAGFEANGGFLLGSAIESPNGMLSPLPTRDAALPALAVLAAAAQAGVPLSALAGDLPGRFTASDRLQEVPAGRSRELLARFGGDPASLLVLAGIAPAEAAAVDTTDGLRVTATNGDVVHLRPSGNAPELRCYSEAGSASGARALVNNVLATLAAGG
ncbi:phosphomannomutase [Cognatiluteimonas lumbrici]|uniref:phosphomannomutase n=1 Tax=Cognatiluteimonas lumbrici TaxID=2559601 RepID=UPI0011269FD8|nr:phosphomannomutase [Luteimonas lumbrici]